MLFFLIKQPEPIIPPNLCGVNDVKSMTLKSISIFPTPCVASTKKCVLGLVLMILAIFL